jgi:glucose-6-phosphate isomerase
MSVPPLWKRYQQYLCRVPALGLTLDVSRMQFEDDFLERMAPPLRRSPSRGLTEKPNEVLP